nr:disintegrin and metalloproteinase domain-containing protein 32-like [Dasypus novemcinctus]
MERAFRRAGKNWWLLASYISLPIIVTIIIVVKWIRLKKLFNKEEESLSSESESSSQTFTSRSRSEGSTQTGSRSQGSNQTYTSSPMKYYYPYLQMRKQAQNC